MVTIIKFAVKGFGNLYQGILTCDLIIPLGHEAQERNDEFSEMFANLTNRLTFEFMQDFCNVDGSINWDKPVTYNSAFIPTIVKVKRKKQNKKLKSGD